MNFYPFHIGDYRRDTHYLSHEGHYIYRTLLDEYYHQELPLPLDKRLLLRKCGLSSDQMPLLEEILSDFFIERTLGYVNKHCERVIDEYKGKAERARVNGSKGGRPAKPRRTQRVPVANPEQTGSKANQEPVTSNQKKTKKGNGRFAPPTVDDVQSYLDERKVKAFTGSYFCDHYIARGWKLSHGKQMSDWKAAVRTWEQKPWNKKDDSDDYGKGAI